MLVKVEFDFIPFLIAWTNITNIVSPETKHIQNNKQIERSIIFWWLDIISLSNLNIFKFQQMSTVNKKQAKGVDLVHWMKLVQLCTYNSVAKVAFEINAVLSEATPKSPILLELKLKTHNQRNTKQQS